MATGMEHEVMNEHTIGQKEGEEAKKTENNPHLTDCF